MSADFVLGMVAGIGLSFLSLLTASSIVRAKRDAVDAEALERAVVRHLRGQ